MKKPILYAVVTAALAAAAIAIVGCNGDLGSGNPQMDAFLVKFHGVADSTVVNYLVTFNANGGSGTPPNPMTVRENSQIQLPDQGRLTRSGYNFGGWNTKPAGDGVNYNAGASYSTTSNSTLYAKWTNAEVSLVTVSSIGIGASGGGSYTDGATVTIKAGTAPEGQQFINWTTSTSGVTFASPSSPTTTFIMPPRAVTVTANFGAVTEGKYAVTVSSVGAGMSGGGSYAAGTTVTINAGNDPFAHRFNNWATESNGVVFANANNRTTTFVMPANAVTVTANFGQVPTYRVEVVSDGIGASRDSSYREGDIVSINAGTAPANQRFKGWTVTSGGVTLGNAESATTTFTMPAKAVTVTANFGANTYTVTVSSVGTGASGGGEYSPGATVTIRAGMVPTGFVFRNWTSSNSNVVFADANNATTTFIMPSAAVTVMANFSGSGTFTDNRDSKRYKIVAIGSNIWMAENLNYMTSNGSWCYADNEVNCNTYGRLYDWNTALMVCPNGWHLPSRGEWGDLAKAAGGTSDYGAIGAAGKALKSTSGWNSNGNGTDEFGFSALPGGYRFSDGDFNYAGYYGYWWSAAEDNSDFAYGRGMYYGYGYVDESNYYKSSGQSVRCVQD